MRSTVGIPSFPRKRWPKAKVGEDVNETAANGTVRVIRTIAKPMAVAMGTKRFRARRAPL